MFKFPNIAVLYTLFELVENILQFSGEIHGILQWHECSIFTVEAPHHIFVSLLHSFNEI